MQEHQVTIGDHSYPLEQPFLVLATQNPIEQEGTYPLPEAQVDRFMLKVKLTYPSKDEELAILNRMAAVEPDLRVEAVLAPADLLELRPPSIGSTSTIRSSATSSIWSTPRASRPNTVSISARTFSTAPARARRSS